MSAVSKVLRVASAAVRTRGAIKGPSLSRQCHFATTDRKAPIACPTRKAQQNKFTKRDLSVDIPLFQIPIDTPAKFRIENSRTAEAPAVRKSLMQYVEELNIVSGSNPMTTFYLFFASRTTTWFVFTKAIGALQVFAGPELAIGWLVARFTSKFRQAANLALSAPLASLFPILTKVKVTGLLGMATPPPVVQQMGEEVHETITRHYKSSTDSMRAAGGRRKSIADAADKAVEYAGKAGTAVNSAMDQLQGPIDKYGMSFYLSSKATSIGTIVAVAAAVNCGVDVPAAMQVVGLPLAMQEVGSGMSCMAAAVILNSLLLPGHIFTAMKLAPGIGTKAVEWEARYVAWVHSLGNKKKQQ